MTHDDPTPRLGWQRRLALLATTALGVAAILGSGGGGGVGVGEDFSLGDPDVFAVTVSAPDETVQIGTPVHFASNVASASGVGLQWQRSTDGHNFVDIPGATGVAYDLPGANRSDDETDFRLHVTSHGHLNESNRIHLVVSSMPAVSFQDAEFADADWTAVAVADPAPAAPVHAEGQLSSGGHPDAYRHNSYGIAAGSSTTVFNFERAGIYDPATQGPIHVLDLIADCRLESNLSLSGSLSLALQQGQRLYTTKNGFFCGTANWGSRGVLTVHADDFVQVAGPACTTSPACPDFTASAAAIRLGYAVAERQPASAAAATVDQGIDNWRVRVWRP